MDWAFSGTEVVWGHKLCGGISCVGHKLWGGISCVGALISRDTDISSNQEWCILLQACLEREREREREERERKREKKRRKKKRKREFYLSQSCKSSQIYSGSAHNTRFMDQGRIPQKDLRLFQESACLHYPILMCL